MNDQSVISAIRNKQVMLIVVFVSLGETEGIGEVASVEGIQQQSSRELKGALLSRSGGKHCVVSYCSELSLCMNRTFLKG
jgi:hypothetical protein